MNRYQYVEVVEAVQWDGEQDPLEWGPLPIAKTIASNGNAYLTVNTERGWRRCFSGGWIVHDIERGTLSVMTDASFREKFTEVDNAQVQSEEETSTPGNTKREAQESPEEGRGDVSSLSASS